MWPVTHHARTFFPCCAFELRPNSSSLSPNAPRLFHELPITKRVRKAPEPVPCIQTEENGREPILHCEVASRRCSRRLRSHAKPATAHTILACSSVDRTTKVIGPPEVAMERHKTITADPMQQLVRRHNLK